MPNRNKKFLELLKAIHIEPFTDIAEGRLEEVRVQKVNLTAHVLLSFPRVLEVDRVMLLMDSIKEYLMQVSEYKKAFVSFTYLDQTMDEKLLERYFTHIVTTFEVDKPRYCVFEKLNKLFTNNEVRIFVATEAEQEMVEELLVLVRSAFTQFGLKNKVSVAISSFETPIEQMIKENMRTSDLEAQKDAKTYEQLKAEKKNELNNGSIRNGKIRRQPRARSDINREPTPLNQLPASESEVIEMRQRMNKTDVVVVGNVIDCQVIERQRRDGDRSKFKIFECVITDGDNYLKAKTFMNENNENFFEHEVQENKQMRIYGYMEFDRFSNDVVLRIIESHIIGDVEKKELLDNAPVRRVELHAHTKMSPQDGAMNIEDYVSQAVKFKHRALAVTDMYNVHVFPDFYNATRDLDITPIFGLEGALVDEDAFQITLTKANFDLQSVTYVVYDIETTGLSSNYNEIIEIAAAKVKNGLIIDEFSSFVKPKHAITSFITELTSITNDDVRGARSIEEVLPEFKKFFEGCVLVAHNATFDNAHLYQNMKKCGIYDGTIHTIDTMQLARVRYGNQLKKFNLKAVAKFFDVDLEQHHRAIYDAKTTAHIFIKMLNDMIDSGIVNYEQINACIDKSEIYQMAYPTHCTLLVCNPVGKKNLYQIVSDSHTVHFAREPRITKHFLNDHRAGLLVGSGCMNGEIFQLAFERSDEEMRRAMQFYDFIEIQPPTIYEVLVEKNQDSNIRDYIRDAIKRIIAGAKACGKIVVATGDVHHLTKDDVILREIYVAAPRIGGGLHDLADIEKLPSSHFMTTEEMLSEFAFLDEALAYEIVVTNTNLIADKIERFPLFPNKLYAPTDNFLADRNIPSFKEAVFKMSYEKAEKRYGKPIPKYIEDRMKKELDSIIGNNFASIYYISYMLVKYSTDAGYIVGSRGSVGSSLIANLMDITEVNPLPPHYYCPECSFTAVKLNDEEKKVYPRSKEEISLERNFTNIDVGFDLPPASCPKCNQPMRQDGIDIPFETFLGFKGEKIPDIDLNFSSEFQATAHEFCREMFGRDNTFRVGTISTIAEKTAYGYVRKYFEKKSLQVREAEINNLVKQIIGGKRSTGQHPGGIVVVPHEIEYSDITPIQFPADDTSSLWRTTHFDYHKFESNLLKFDILGHDDPTMIRHLMDFVAAYPNEFPFTRVEDIPLTDKDVFGLFSGLQSLRLTSDQLAGEVIGTTGIPEFGTSIAKEMLDEIGITSVSDLIKASGLSHGENVWRGNARDFLQGTREGYPPVSFKELIGCRDDIMAYLIHKGLPAGDAFKIMESVRKGKGVSKEFEKEMMAYQVPKWYIDSCKLIQYMFPKAHAAAYVIMALRIGWFKIHRPIFYYAGYFSRRAKAFDVVAMLKGYETIRIQVLRLADKIKNKTANPKETDTHYTLLLALEMTARGFSFAPIDIVHSHATNFLILKDKKTLLMPFNALDSLGEATALSIVAARNEMPFTSKRDVLRRTKINTTLFERLDQLGTFGDLPDEDQIGLF